VTDVEPFLARVRLAIFDFDGVFTDNRVWVNERGEEMLAFTRSDGLGLRRLDAVGLPVVPADAWPEVRSLARWVLSRPGGAGCVREFCDAVWAAQR
jgi:3-deoxy-D-manno-octulosonate 8-phosphate phosphatase KdsC-like HAD superfamily phosphatase